MSNRLIRQQDLINSDILTTPLFMVGLGGIGSWTAISLAKMGFNNMILWDIDIVSEENFNNNYPPARVALRLKLLFLKTCFG